MTTPTHLFVFAAAIQVIFSQDDKQPAPPISSDVPQQCWGPPQGVHLPKCCPLKPMYSEEELLACGFQKPVPGLPPREKSDCGPQTCLFKNKGLLDDDGKLDYDKIEPFIDAWAENQSHIIEGVQKAKETCLRKDTGPPVPQRPFGPFFKRSCEIDKLYVCITTTIFWNCNINEEGGCKTLKDHMDECRPWLYKETDQ